MGRHTQADAQQQLQASRPKRKATNAHIFRYLQTRNPSKLEENDLKRALEVSLEECPDFWPEDSASCSSSEQSNANSISSSASSSSSSSASCLSLTLAAQPGVSDHPASGGKQRRLTGTSKKATTHLSQKSCNSRKYGATASGGSRLTNRGGNHCSCHANHPIANPNCCPMSSARNRYKPVAKRNIYIEADYFHEGIMDYIEYQLYEMAKARKTVSY